MSNILFGYSLAENAHMYSLTASGIRFRSKTFPTRIDATTEMYKFMSKHGLSIEEVYDDKHVKTYICKNDIRFYIDRV